MVKSLKLRDCLGWPNSPCPYREKAGTPWTDVWGDRCDKARREHITTSLKALVRGEQAPPLPAQPDVRKAK